MASLRIDYHILMKTSLWAWAEQSPIVIVPVAGAAFGLALLPFLVAGTEKAAEFYGSFAAAIVAAIAVILGASYQAHLARKRDEELRIADLVSTATEVFLWLERCITELERAAYRLDEFAKRSEAGAASTVPMTYEYFRIHFMPIDAKDANEKLSLLSKFPIELALSVSSAIQVLASAYGPNNPNVLRDETPVKNDDFKYWSKKCTQARALFRTAQSQISFTLNKSYGTSLPINSDIKEAAKTVQVLATER